MASDLAPPRSESKWLFPSFSARISADVNCMCTTRNMRWLFSGSNDGTIRQYDFFQSINQEPPHAQGDPGASATYPAASDAVTLHHWPKPYEDQSVTAMACQPEGVWLLAGTRSGMLKLYGLRIHEHQNIFSHQIHKDYISGLCLRNNETLCVTTSWDGTLKTTDLHSGSPIYDCGPDLKHSSQATSLAHSPVHGLIATSSIDGTCKLWDLRQRKPPHTLKPPSSSRSTDNWILSCAWLSDNMRLVHGGRGGKLVEWDLRKPDEATRTKVVGSPANSILSLSAVHDYLAVGTTGSGIHLISTAPENDWSQNDEARLVGTSVVSCILTDPEGRFLVSGCGTRGWKVIVRESTEEDESMLCYDLSDYLKLEPAAPISSFPIDVDLGAESHKGF
eukprot:m.206104 g.206104  ORF g.206104 m.206104 type:complete len:391 (+) comp15019_c3_seq2:1086-2258(+)